MNPRPPMTNKTSEAEPTRYEIRHISDIFQIPEERFADFLVDFESFYRMGKPMCELIETIADEAARLQIKSVIEKMAWIDDSKHDVTVYIKELQSQTRQTEGQLTAKKDEAEDDN
jgi:hypothetical protein